MIDLVNNELVKFEVREDYEKFYCKSMHNLLREFGEQVCEAVIEEVKQWVEENKRCCCKPECLDLQVDYDLLRMKLKEVVE